MLKNLILKWPKRIVSLAWYLLLILITVGIVVSNPDKVTVNFFGFTNEVKLGLVLCLFFVLGGCFGLLMGEVTSYFHKRKAKKAEKEVARLKAENTEVLNAKAIQATPQVNPSE